MRTKSLFLFAKGQSKAFTRTKTVYLFEQALSFPLPLSRSLPFPLPLPFLPSFLPPLILLFSYYSLILPILPINYLPPLSPFLYLLWRVLAYVGGTTRGPQSSYATRKPFLACSSLRRRNEMSSTFLLHLGNPARSEFVWHTEIDCPWLKEVTIFPHPSTLGRG